MTSHIVIVGAGHAGAAASAFLRQYGYAGRLTLLGDEGELPYQRPPLSKDWLSGQLSVDDIALRPHDFYSEQRIDIRLDSTAVRIDRGRKALLLASGEELGYDILVLATGSRPIMPVLKGKASGVMALRNVHDARRLKSVLHPGSAIVIAGAGYLGLEVAATARAMGVSVAVVERERRVLSWVADPMLSEFVACAHRRHGVDLVLERSVARVETRGGAIEAVELDDGRIVPCDVVLSCIGAHPNEELAQAAGLACEHGILVDLQARTSDPAIFAIGDVTRRPMPFHGIFARLESIPNAVEQAKHAACAITGRAAPAHEVPWQWSDQYDLRIQIAGHADGADNTIARGSPSAGAFSLFHFRGDALLAVEAVNSAPEFMTGRQLIGRDVRLDKRRLADVSMSMKEIVNWNAPVATTPAV